MSTKLKLLPTKYSVVNSVYYFVKVNYSLSFLSLITGDSRSFEENIDERWQEELALDYLSTWSWMARKPNHEQKVGI